LDKVNMPLRGSFKSPEEYFSTLFHELAHSTGHQSRLNRRGIGEQSWYGSESYSKEELVAELAASFLCAEAGIENRTFENSVGYLHGWLQQLKGNSKLLIEAAAQATKACDLILGRHADESEGD